MSFDVLISEAAEADIRDAFIWYYNETPNTALEFETEVKEQINRIAANPNKYQVKYAEVRVSYLRTFPYGIHYRLNRKTILISGVFHTSQSPRNWRSRF